MSPESNQSNRHTSRTIDTTGRVNLRKIIIQLPFKNAMELIEHKFVYFNSNNCLDSLNGIIAPNNFAREWSREESFASYRASTYGENRIDVMNPIHNKDYPPTEVEIEQMNIQSNVEITEALETLEIIKTAQQIDSTITNRDDRIKHNRANIAEINQRNQRETE